MTLSANFTSKSVFNQQGCRALTFALARLSCFVRVATDESCRILGCRPKGSVALSSFSYW